MTKIMFIGVMLIGVFSAQAGEQVCAGKTLYYSSIKKDFGTPPPAGTNSGSLTIVHSGKILASETYQVGLGQHQGPGYELKLATGEVVKTTGNKKLGSSVSITTATLYKVAKAPGAASKPKEVVTEEVVCKKSWMMAF